MPTETEQFIIGTARDVETLACMPAHKLARHQSELEAMQRNLDRAIAKANERIAA